jgi:OmpA-OmpF porin, OOP family
MKNFASIVAAAVASLVSTGAFAQAYISGAVGQGHANLDCAGVASCNNNGTAFKAVAGFGFGNGLAAELGYINFGKAKASDAGLAVELKTEAITLGGAFLAPIATDWNLSARLGVASVKANASASLVGVGSGSQSETKTQVYGGFGVGYAVTKNASLEASADFSRFEFGGEKASLRALTLGARYTF